MTHTVLVWGKPQEVTVERKTKSVWIATGTYSGENIVTKDRSEKTAVKRWREAAQYRGNG